LESAKLALKRVIGDPVDDSTDRKRRFVSVTTIEHSTLRFERQDDPEIYVGI